jgi:hypothetical protein
MTTKPDAHTRIPLTLDAINFLLADLRGALGLWCETAIAPDRRRQGRLATI